MICWIVDGIDDPTPVGALLYVASLLVGIAKYIIINWLTLLSGQKVIRY